MHDASRNGKKDVKISEHFSNLLRDMFVPQNYQNVPCLIYFLSVYNISIKVKSLSHSDFQTIHVPILGVVVFWQLNSGSTPPFYTSRTIMVDKKRPYNYANNLLPYTSRRFFYEA